MQQNAFHKDDTYVGLPKQKRMMDVILHLYERSKEIVARSIPLSRLMNTGLFDKVTRMKYDIPNDQPELFDAYLAEIDAQIDAILSQGGTR